MSVILETLQQREARIRREKLWHRFVDVLYFGVIALAIGAAGAIGGYQVGLRDGKAYQAEQPKAAPFSCKEALRICENQLRRRG